MDVWGILPRQVRSTCGTLPFREPWISIHQRFEYELGAQPPEKAPGVVVSWICHRIPTHEFNRPKLGLPTSKISTMSEVLVSEWQDSGKPRQTIASKPEQWVL